ncbi:M50 family metallopeptidase [Caldalkalibacillus mannanilyticus]|uniref:M50 family metallopeptidase n=1 Tax=Caldalkalibacillus mannanilyticus TaxID=1418 RepID=UPI000469BEFC|nr:M50 family metallopeptidase [Caldalkalibacillus mannanilyticus]
MIKLSIHPSFFLVFFLALLHGFIYDVMLLFIIVIIHELGHACTAKAYGWRVRKIQLLPFGGVAEVDEHGNRSTKEEMLVIVAGPLMNLIMIFFGLICLFSGLWQESFAMQFIEYNMIIFLFNLLPILPLDGGKLVQIMLCTLFPFRKAIRHSLLVSGVCFFMYLVIIILFYPLYFYLWIVAIFLFISHILELKQSHFQFMRFILERYSKNQNHDLEVVSIVAYPTEALHDLIVRMYRNKYHYFCIVDEKGNISYVISEQELLDQYFAENKAYCTVSNAFG